MLIIKNLRTAIAAGLILCIVFSLVSCSGVNETIPQISVAIVIGKHTNSKNINLNNGIVSDTVRDAVYSYGLVSVICADGKPDLIISNLYDIPDQYKQASIEKLKSDAEKKALALLSSLVGVKANDLELDTLESLRLAVRSLASAPIKSRKFIVVMDTGLSTTGLLDFRNNILEADPLVIANILAEKLAIPNFSEITVRWSQLGDTAAPQQPLSPAQRKKLIDIWRAIVEKSGGKFEESDIVANPGDILSEQYPYISKVEIPAELSIAFNPQKVSVFNEEQVRFIGDTANYVNPQTARNVLFPVAEYMKSHPGFSGLLAGSTASSNNKSFCMQLSLARANAVRNTLISLGVSPNQITTVGLGNSDPWHIQDKSPDGTYIETFASKNRKVVLLDASSSEGQDILKH